LAARELTEPCKNIAFFFDGLCLCINRCWQKNRNTFFSCLDHMSWMPVIQVLLVLFFVSVIGIHLIILQKLHFFHRQKLKIGSWAVCGSKTRSFFFCWQSKKGNVHISLDEITLNYMVAIYVVEMVINIRIRYHLHIKKMLVIEQVGFRKGMCTENATFKWTYSAFKSINKKNVC
jgi:hypothetical protein